MSYRVCSKISNERGDKHLPNRILKESICYSDDIDRLTAFEETVFYRLIVNADDFGRMDGRIPLLKSMLFRTKKGITEKNIEDAISKLASVGLVQCYIVDDKPFLQFPKWELHQVVRAKKSKFPAPESNCKQMISNDFKCFRNPIQSESESESECMPGAVPVPGNAPDPIIEFPLNDKSLYPIFPFDVEEWEKLYPSVDVMQQLRNMRGWLDANPTRRKTKSGIKGFVNKWLMREQDKGKPCKPSKSDDSESSIDITAFEKLGLNIPEFPKRCV